MTAKEVSDRINSVNDQLAEAHREFGQIQYELGGMQARHRQGYDAITALRSELNNLTSTAPDPDPEPEPGKNN